MNWSKRLRLRQSFQHLENEASHHSFEKMRSQVHCVLEARAQGLEVYVGISAPFRSSTAT
jgi:hypothetical protein